MDLADPTATAILCTQALAKAGLAYAVCGGLALAAYGVPRETRDVDVAVVDATTIAAAAALTRAGLDVAVTFDDVQFGGLRLGRVTLLGGLPDVAPEVKGLNVLDLVRPRSARYAAALVRRAVEGKIRGVSIQVISLEDFVTLKVLASRDRDLEDAASVLDVARGVIDLAEVAAEVERLAAEIPDWDVRGRWVRIRPVT